MDDGVDSLGKDHYNYNRISGTIKNFKNTIQKGFWNVALLF